MLVGDGGGGSPAFVAVPDPAEVSAAAALFPPIATRMDAAVAAVKTAWSGLGGAGVFETPDTREVLAATAIADDLAELVRVRAAGAKTALEDYASALSGVIARMTALEPDVAAVTAAAAAPPASTPAAGPDPTEVAAQVGRVNAAAIAADEECAAALRKLAQVLSGAAVEAILGAHAFMERGGDAGWTAFVKTLEHYRRSLLPEGEDSPALVEPADIEVVATQDGFEFAESSKSGLLLPVDVVRDEQAAAAEPPTSEDPYATEDHGHGYWVADADADEEGKLAWLEPADHAVVAAGAVLTIGATGLEQYREDEEEHPDWSTSHDVEDAGVAAATTGVGTAAGTWAGAEAGGEIGGEWGFMIGTAICPGVGTVVGTVVGGVIGAVAGGFIGGKIGGDIGSGVHHLVSDVGSWF